MRRTARVLSAAALAVLAGAGPAAAADDPADPVDPPGSAAQAAPVDPPGPAAPAVPDDPAGPAAADPGDPASPAAQISPASVEPGGTVTVSVTCDPTGGPAPQSIEASSQAAFADGTVKLQKVPGGDDELSGPAYKGTAKIAPAEDFDGLSGTGSAPAWTVDGTCPAPPGGQGRPWSATFDVARSGSSHGATAGPACPEPHPTACPGQQKPDAPAQEPAWPQPTARPPAVEHGVHAGQGGAFTASVPALVAGGLLIAGAAGAAAHRLRHRGRGHG
ncbi:hypothetical protein [Streptomyces sp. NPDC014806]|uniref:hypothetical protein n=1 Tax=Streptomyces sp. NPDC014806 TaxID=3364920 RepID=UPI0036FEDAA3